MVEYRIAKIKSDIDTQRQTPELYVRGNDYFNSQLGLLDDLSLTLQNYKNSTATFDDVRCSLISHFPDNKINTLFSRL
jgi:hypothetical protein